MQSIVKMWLFYMKKYRKPVNSSALTCTAVKEEEGESFSGIYE